MTQPDEKIEYPDEFFRKVEQRSRYDIVRQQMVWGYHEGFKQGRNSKSDEEHRRIDRALSVLAKLDRLPDAGTHDPDCWLTENHRDCLAELLERILRGAQ